MSKKLFALIIFLFLPNISIATSGACSYHGGVNCSYGSTSTGKVMCNDGWTNSSVYFSDAEECKKIDCSVHLITTGLNLSCRTDFDYQRKLEQITKQRNDCKFSKSMGYQISTDCSVIGQLELDDCLSAIDLVNVFNEGYEKCLNQRSEELIDDLERKEIAKDSDRAFLFSDDPNLYINIKMNKLCASTGSTWDSKSQNCIISTQDISQPENKNKAFEKLVKEAISPDITVQQLNPASNNQAAIIPSPQSVQQIQRTTPPPTVPTKQVFTVLNENKPTPELENKLSEEVLTQNSNNPHVENISTKSNFFVKTWNFIKNIFKLGK